MIGERTRKPDRLKISELFFTDDAAAVGTSRRSLEAAATAVEELISAWGLSLSISKTKLFVAGTPHGEDLLLLQQLAGGSVECVTDSLYLGSVVETKEGVEKEVYERIARASRAFGMLKSQCSERGICPSPPNVSVQLSCPGGIAVWIRNLDHHTQHNQETGVIPQLIPKRNPGHFIEQQRMERITSIQIAKQFGLDDSLEDTITARCLRWLGHLARMEGDGVPKKVLFGWLPQPRP